VKLYFNYKKPMSANAAILGRSGARRMKDVPPEVLELLEAGEAETVNLMEWLAADMAKLARAVAAQQSSRALRSGLLACADEMAGLGVTGRLRRAGRAIALSCQPHDAEFGPLREHKSDLVRQWACYAVNDSGLSLSLDRRLEETLPFAADRNMSVRETAWMAFRPHLAESLDVAMPRVEDLTRHSNENIRRFAVEVTRPRSVWGAHLPALKRHPERGRRLLERVRADRSRYVKLAVGNWLNDASRTRPDWVLGLCEDWAASDDPHTRFIIKRGLRTIARSQISDGRLPLRMEQTQILSAVENGHD
jgi:3-methyladenine DNA glycosylase AlkC